MNPGRDRTTIGRGPYLHIEVRCPDVHEAVQTARLDKLAWELHRKLGSLDGVEVVVLKVRNGVRAYDQKPQKGGV